MRRRRAVKESSTTNRSMRSIQMFRQHNGASDARVEGIALAMETFASSLPSMEPTSRVVAPVKIAGFQNRPLTGSSARQVVRLCKRKKLIPPSQHMRDQCQHFFKYSKSKVVSYLALSVYNLNRTPGAVCVCVELAVSVDPDHSMSHAISDICKTLRRRKRMCILFTQVAGTETALNFWRGRLTHTKRASAMNGMLSNFDTENNKVYDDTTDMAIFFD